MNLKVLMQKQLLGGLFMQYKTVPLARLQMQNHPTGAVNVTARRPVVDPESKKQIYEVVLILTMFKIKYLYTGVMV